MEDWEEEHVPVVLKKELIKSNWDDEDADDNDVKESWEDEEEEEEKPKPAPKEVPKVEKAPKKQATKSSEQKEKKPQAIEIAEDEPLLDPVAEKLRQQRLVEESDFKWDLILVRLSAKMAAGQSAAATCASIFSSTNQIVSSPTRSASNTIITSVSSSTKYGSFLPRYWPIDRKVIKFNGRVTAAAAVASPAVATPGEEIKECTLPTWAEFELGRAPIFWKTTNALPPTAGENLKLFYNPAAKNLVPNEAFGIAFNGGFNQPIMCGGEPRAMLQKVRGKADPPFYTIQICIPKHALNLIFSFTNGNEWDGPYRLQFQVPKPWRNKPIEFFTEGLAQELSKEGACDRAIFPDTDVVSTRCAMIGNLTVEGGDRCDLDLVLGCTDPSSPLFDPLANVDDGTCPPYSDSEE